ncbi:3-ketoacyl-ACP reductase [Piscinibacter sp. XHJ-5]|uniref:3-ketoacyl-ACP reductase n=1 Tax=Piscinibacter sp. XHJ-5 TaxID=3037797 RepID=UPI002452F50C|nr:3-ketoacyl-ACP reductase [Piscinibacter sp. XHJ-5]
MSTSPLAVVTGARRGIGAAIAIEMASAGFDVAITDIDTGGAEATLDAIAARGRRGALFESDLSAIDSHAAVVERIVAWGGPIACLVNNAGVPAVQRGDLLDVTALNYDRALDINLRGTFFFTQAVARHMAATRSDAARTVVTVSSVSAEMASPERGEYCVSKAGLTMVTKLFALRLAALGVGVFEVRPGVIRTPMTEGVASHYDQRIANGLVPMGRWGEPADVACAVAALAGGRLAFATGSVINVDGALSIQRL